MKEIQASLDRYVKHHIKCGSFLNYVLENDLFGAIGKADYSNRTRMWDICNYIYNEIPANVWGSKEKVETHLSKRMEIPHDE